MVLVEQTDTHIPFFYQYDFSVMLQLHPLTLYIVCRDLLMIVVRTRTIVR